MLNDAQIDYVCKIVTREMEFYKIGSKDKQKLLIKRLKETAITKGMISDVCHSCLGTGFNKKNINN